MITANLGALLARQGNRVVLVDLDLGASNLHTFLGQPDTDRGLESFLGKAVVHLDQVAMPTEIANLFFISSRNCLTEAANLYVAQKQKIIRAIQKLDFDYVLMDLGAGTNFNMLDFFLTTNQGIFICTPEPTSIENSFNFIKAVYFRVIKKTLKQTVFNRVTRRLDLSGNTIDQSFRIINAVTSQDPEMGVLLKKRLSDFHFRFVVNQLRKNDDPSLGFKIEKVCNRHFYSKFTFLGNIRYDERIHESILMRKTFILKYSHAPSAKDLARIAGRLIVPKEERGSLKESV
ncbi:MAG: AAA family ATPase [Proteobacteria bacterium]|nr:MinD/ParA family protein [Desulfobacula sp.]MBU3954165.1 AAA family ATPase [Pseudomonadota bacterium]MBU4131737.1 AAA family ATPase [Pseudomonadota bacterium]